VKSNKLLILILTLAISVSFLVGCSAEKVSAPKDEEIEQNQEEVVKSKDEYGVIINEDTVSFTDGTGEEITINKNPERTIILFASFLDIWTRNGGELVGMVEDTSERAIPGTEGVETVGKTGAISLEKIISLKPDLVILSSNTTSQMEMVPQLKQNNIPVIAFDYKFKDDYYKIVKLFSAINEREDLYEENAVSIEKEIQDIIEKTKNSNPPKVFLMYASSRNLSARGSNTTIGEIVRDLNAINIVDGPNDFLEDQSFSMEKLIKEDPDFILVQNHGSDQEKVMERIKEEAESNPAWGSLSAVKNDRYIFLPKDLFTYKANHRYAEAYEYLAKILYPEVFNK
jgi:iron complex transport system substrate-binding protein